MLTGKYWVLLARLFLVFVGRQNDVQLGMLPRYYILASLGRFDIILLSDSSYNPVCALILRSPPAIY